MLQLSSINSNTYWDNRFTHNWALCSGPSQSRFFARLALENLPSWLKDQIRHHDLTVVDWGCAQGDGTDVWCSYINPNLLFGVDFSSVAIEHAKSHYPAIQFACENWLDSNADTAQHFDVVFSSNTLEHFHRPYEVLEILSSRATKAVVLALPYKELDRLDEHFYSFLPENIPLELSNGYRLIWCKVIDCVNLPDTLWGGHQIVLVYAEASWISSLKLRLVDCELGQEDTAAIADRDGQITHLNQEIADRDKQITHLNQEIVDRDGQITHLNQEIVDRDGQITHLNQEIVDRDEQITHLNQEIVDCDEQITHLNQEIVDCDGQITNLQQIKDSMVCSVSWRATHPLRLLKKYPAIFCQFFKPIKCQLLHKAYRIYLRLPVQKIQNKAISRIKYFLYRSYKKLPFKYQKPLKRIAQHFHYKRSVQSIISTTNTDDRVVRWIEELLKNTDLSRLVVCIQPTFFIPDGSTCYNGGAERYMTDLSRLFIRNNYEFWVIQLAKQQSWIQRYEHLLVVALPSVSDHDLFLKYASLLVAKATVFIASPFPYASHFSTMNIYTIGISHGVYWDRPEYNNEHFQSQLVNSVEKINHLISVDTNTINEIKALKTTEYTSNITYIPNYVDPSFKKIDFELPVSIAPDDTVILFPRRLHEARGFHLITELIPEAFHKHNSLIFLFCGHGDAHEIKVLDKLTRSYPNRIYHFILEPKNVYASYKISDIVLIPTLYSEGTSLSCIEAMESQKAIIATCVGGLTDLIIDQHSGLLVKPNKNEVLSALFRLIEDKSLRDTLGKNAFDQAKQFHKKRWEEHWEHVIKQIPNYEHVTKPITMQNYTLLHPSTFLVYDVMKQRPQHLLEACANIDIPCFYIDAIPHVAPKLINKNLYLLDKDSTINYTNYCVYTYYPYHYLEFIKNKPHVLIYDVLDAPEIHQSQEALACHENMLALADIIITSSKLLYERYKKELKQQEIHYIPNAACPESLKSQPKAMDFPYFKNATIGYYGAIADWFDFKLLDKLCLAMSECQILLLGPCRKGFPEYEQLSNLLKKHNNLFYLGLKPYEELTRYAHYFDVSIIPFLENEITKNCSPVKLFEYMNMHKPIVTTEMPECRFYHSALVASNHIEFIDLVKKALQLGTQEEYFTIMKKEAEENTWNARASVIKDALQRVCIEKGDGRKYVACQGKTNHRVY